MVHYDLQAVVLSAGKGTRYPELLEGRPKCLLPIGPNPLIWYPLHLLQRHGFAEATIVVLESEKSEIQQRLEKFSLKLKLDYFVIDRELDCGTAETLRLLSDRVKSDLVVLSCDIVVNVDLYPLLSKFRELDASLMALILPGASDQDVQIPGPKAKPKVERDLIGLNRHNANQLVFMASTSDFEETVKLPGHLLRSNPEISFSARLLDAHVYVMKKWTIDFLKESDGISTVKGELLPYVIKKQMSSPGTVVDLEHQSEVNLNTKTDDIFRFAQQSEYDRKIEKASIFNKQEKINVQNPIRCYAYIPKSECVGFRVNNIRSFFAANLKIFDHYPMASVATPEGNLIAATSTVKSKQVVKCSIGDQATISEKTSLQSSVVANNVTVHPKVRIVNSVIMDGAVVEESVTIENSIIGEKAVVQTGSVLKNCLIGPQYVVPADSQKENSYLSNSDGFMEID